MRKEGRQHGMVRTYAILSAPRNARPRPSNLNQLSCPPAAGIFAKVSAKPTNHSKFTSKCSRPMCRQCHAHPASKSKDKVKGTHKIRSSSDDCRFVDCRGVSGLKFSGLSATRVLNLLARDGYVDCDREVDGNDGIEEVEGSWDQVGSYQYSI